MRTLKQNVFLTISATAVVLTSTASPVLVHAQTYDNSFNYTTSSPAAANQSVPPLSDNVPAAGPSSASSPSASFVPQIAQHGDEAEPVLPNSVVPTSAYWADVLGIYTKAGEEGLIRFDYAALKASAQDMENLGKYIDHMVAQKPSTLSRNDAMAYWANLYNALTVQLVAQNYPVKSIRKIKSGYRAGPWKRKLVKVEGNKLSLDNIDHDILRPTYQSPLVHYMVNCASIGCPNLKTTPWQGATLAADQKAAARTYINSPRGAKIKDNRLYVSSIYKWFKADFGDDTADVLSHLNQYADADLRTALAGRKKIDKYTYDWAVNAPK